MHLTKFLHTRTGKYLMSAILGFGLASLFRVVCKDKKCIVVKAPPLEEMKKDDVYKFGDKCYSFTRENAPCKSGKKISFA